MLDWHSWQICYPLKKCFYYYYEATLFPESEPRHEKTCLILCANNKGADQPTHPRS